MSEENDYQKKLVAFLAEVHRRSEVPSIVAVDMLALPEHLWALILPVKLSLMIARVPI